MTGILAKSGFLDAARFGAGMVLDPIAAMRRAGTETAQAKVMKFGLDPARNRKFIYLTGARNVAPVLLDAETFQTSNVSRRARGGGAQSRLRRGLIGAQGAEHRHYRAAFIAETGKTMRERFTGAVARHIDQALGGLPADRPIDLIAFINDLVRSYSVFGMYHESDIALALKIGRDVTEWMDLAYSPGTIAFPFRLPGTPFARFMRKSEELEQALLEWASSRRDMDPSRDLLSRFVNGPDENGGPLTPGRLAGHVMNLYAASFSSSAASLIWILYLLMQHPDIAHSLCHEIEGSGMDPMSGGQDLLALPLLDQVCKEAMRLFTPVPYQVRRVTRDAEAAGIPVRRKDVIVIGTWAHNRLADVYIEPARFWPERWAASKAGEFDCLTFSAGPRRCVGYLLAQIMIKVTVWSLLRQRHPRVVPHTRIDTRVAINLRSRQPIPVIMAPRDQPFRRAPVTGTVERIYVLPGET